jgi:hypothetical protein
MLDIQTRKQIRALMQDPRWNAFELAFDEYKREYFLETSFKREDEFNTIWNVAHSEGGKYHLNSFINTLEQAAQYD